MRKLLIFQLVLFSFGDKWTKKEPSQIMLTISVYRHFQSFTFHAYQLLLSNLQRRMWSKVIIVAGWKKTSPQEKNFPWLHVQFFPCMTHSSLVFWHNQKKNCMAWPLITLSICDWGNSIQLRITITCICWSNLRRTQTKNHIHGGSDALKLPVIVAHCTKPDWYKNASVN